MTRSLETKSITVGPSYMVQFNLLMGCGSVFASDKNNQVNLDFFFFYPFKFEFTDSICFCLNSLCNMFLYDLIPRLNWNFQQIMVWIGFQCISLVFHLMVVVMQYLLKEQFMMLLNLVNGSVLLSVFYQLHGKHFNMFQFVCLRINKNFFISFKHLCAVEPPCIKINGFTKNTCYIEILMYEKNILWVSVAL